MARIIVGRRTRDRRRTATPSGRRRPLRVRIVGRLRAADLGRLEAACGPALEHQQLALELDLGRVQAFDTSAIAYLRRLRARGATLIGERVLVPVFRGDDAGDRSPPDSDR